MKRIILASTSPRRAELIKYIPAEITICGADTNEEFSQDACAQDNVMHIAYEKAAYVKQIKRADEYDVIVAADTIVVAEGLILGKPKNEENAADMLRVLSGREHTVMSGVCVLNGEKTLTFCEETAVRFFDLSATQISEYVKSKEPLDKAGAYAIQGKARLFIDKIDGNYDNVVGLPLSKLYKVLVEEFGF